MTDKQDRPIRLIDRVAALELRVLALERDIERISNNDIFHYQWDSADKTMKYIGGNND